MVTRRAQPRPGAQVGLHSAEIESAKENWTVPLGIVSRKEMLVMRIAAICATPRNRNTGMRCVDRALQLVLGRTDHPAAVDYFCFDLPNYVIGEDVFDPPINQ